MGQAAPCFEELLNKAAPIRESGPIVQCDTMQLLIEHAHG